jgi:hypothetical protein
MAVWYRLGYNRGGWQHHYNMEAEAGAGAARPP